MMRDKLGLFGVDDKDKFNFRFINMDASKKVDYTNTFWSLNEF